jgi:hypothetical protein
MEKQKQRRWASTDKTTTASGITLRTEKRKLFYNNLPQYAKSPLRKVIENNFLYYGM